MVPEQQDDVTACDLKSFCRRNPIRPPERFPYGGIKPEMDYGREKRHERRDDDAQPAVTTPRSITCESRRARTFASCDKDKRYSCLLVNILSLFLLMRDTRWRSLSGYSCTSRKDAGSVLDEVTAIFHCLNTSDHADLR